jgi:hypothetical protein
MERHLTTGFSGCTLSRNVGLEIKMTNPRTKEDVDQALAEESQFKHIWISLDDGQSMTVLINGDIGWLMYLRTCEDSGFSTRNPEYAEAVGTIIFILDNGQGDEYPAHWTYPVSRLREALHEFLETHRLPMCVSWHDDSLQDEKK